jgi:hypothetical protein
MAQAKIMDSAIKRAQDAEPYEIVTFSLGLSEVILSDGELAALRQMGMTDYMPFIRQALVAIPARHLIELAELPSIIMVM